MKKHDLSVFEIEKEGFRLKLQRGASAPQGTVVPPAAAAGPAKAAATGAETPLSAPKPIESAADERDRVADGGHVLSRCFARCAGFC